MDHRGVRGPEGHGGDGAPPEPTPPAVVESDPLPWIWPEGQHAANPATQVDEPAWAAYWENQTLPPAANSALVSYTGQYPSPPP